MTVRTLFARLMLAMVLLLAVTAGLRTLLLDAIYPRFYRGQVREEMLRNARNVAAWAATALGADGRVAAAGQEQVRLLARLANARIWLVSADGLVRVDTGGEPGWEGVRLRSDDLAAVQAGREVMGLEPSPGLEGFLAVGVPVRSGGQVTGAVFLFVPHALVRQSSTALRTLFISTGLAAISLGLVLAYLLSRQVARAVRGQDLAVALSPMGARLREALAALAAEKSRMGAIIAAMAEGVIAVAADGRVLLCNPAAARLLACRPEGRPLEDAGLPPALAGALREALRRSAANAPVPLTMHGGEVLALVSSVVAGDGAPVGAVAVLQDVTSAAGLQRARENFVANVSHELRSPLHSMLLLVDALADGTIPPELQTAYFTRLRGEVTRLQRLTNDLLELSRIDAGIVTVPVEAVDLHFVAVAVTERLEPRAGAAGVALRNDVAPGTLLLGNADRLEQVLTNLVENAIRFTPEGGAITVGAQVYPDAVRVLVRDTGMGIPPERLPHIWDRFYKADTARTRTSAGGTGLGLAIVKHLVELQGGEVGVESREGEGATFFFILPAPPPAAWPPRAAGANP